MTDFNGIEAYPLTWPEGRKRIAAYSRVRSKFKTTFDGARIELQRELDRMRARRMILSTNVPLRKDGNPYGSFRRVDDPGVAVYFEYKDKRMVFACDKYDRTEDNLHAIVKTIEALRGIARWGTGDMMERAFTGFAQLAPGSTERPPWWEIIGVDRMAHPDRIREKYLDLARKYHPDLGIEPDGSKMTELNIAYKNSKGEF